MGSLDNLPFASIIPWVLAGWPGGQRESESIPHTSTKVYKAEIKVNNQSRGRGRLQVIEHAMQMHKHVVESSLIICPA